MSKTRAFFRQLSPELTQDTQNGTDCIRNLCPFPPCPSLPRKTAPKAMGTELFSAQNQARPSPATPPNFFASHLGDLSQNHMSPPQNATSHQAPSQRRFFSKSPQNWASDSRKSLKNHRPTSSSNPIQPLAPQRPTRPGNPPPFHFKSPEKPPQKYPTFRDTTTEAHAGFALKTNPAKP